MVKSTVLLLLCLTAVGSCAQEVLEQHLTQTPANAQFEIHQLGAQPNATFRLDKFTGQVAVLKVSDDVSMWENMPVEKLPTAGQRVPRFQFSNWGNNPSRLFLLDTFTGQTWQLDMFARRPQPTWVPFGSTR